DTDRSTHAVNLTNDPAEDKDPEWSPDSTLIAFESDRDGNREIYVMDTNGNTDDAVNRTNDPGDDFDAVWSPQIP
ncbi:MAG: PD40 domain-containing protein, partial [Myxococcales bacterium]|nr:PD40 domain-containing protein [Myxococcales bacterium]